MNERASQLLVETLPPLQLTVAQREVPAAYRTDPQYAEYGRYGTLSEDVSHIDYETSTITLADGAGGEKGSNPRAAATAAVFGVNEYFKRPEVQQAIDRGDLSREELLSHMRQAFRFGRENVNQFGEGGLAAVLCVKPVIARGERYLLIGNAGDCRALISPPVEVPGLASREAKASYTDEQGSLLKPDILYQLTDDQSQGKYLMNGFSAREARLDGSQDNYLLVPLKNGSRLVMGSDGIFGDTAEQFLQQDELARAFSPTISSEEAADYLLERSRKIDDKSLIVIDFGTPSVVPTQVETPQQQRQSAPAKPFNAKTQNERLRAMNHLADLRDAYAAALVAHQALPQVEATYTQPSDDTTFEDAKRAYEAFTRRIQRAEAKYLKNDLLESDEGIEYAAAVATDLEAKALEQRVSEYRLANTDDDMFNDHGELVETPLIKRQVGKVRKWISNRFFAVTPLPAAQPYIGEGSPDLATYVVLHEQEETPAPRPGMMQRAHRRLAAVRQGMKDKALYSAAVMTNLFRIDPSKEFVGRLEEEKKQRIAWGVVLGVAALYATSRFGVDHLPFDNPFGGHDGGSGSTPPEGSGQSSGPQHTPPESQPPLTPKGPESQIPHHVTMARGDTVWGIAEHSLGKGASVEDIDRVKDTILQQNGISEAQAYYLPVDTRLRMPVELIEELSKQHGN